MSTHSDGFAVKQDDKAIGDRDNGCTALAEFEIELERALADLRLSIGDIVPRRYIKLNSDDDDVDVGVGDPYDRIEDSSPISPGRCSEPCSSCGGRCDHERARDRPRAWRRCRFGQPGGGAGPGHSSKDRSLSILITGSGFIVHSFAGDDWRVCKDYVRSRLGRLPFNQRRRS